jgi:feruloyl esterase
MNPANSKLAAALVLSGGVAALSGCGGSSPTQAEICIGMVSASLPNVRVTNATVVAGTADLTGVSASNTPVHTGPLPDHCLVQGVANERTGQNGKAYGIGFEIRMPITGWNGRFYFQGGGGVNGALATAFGDLRGNILSATGWHEDNALNRGFAVASTDGGHLADTKSTDGNGQTVFGEDPQARLDYGYNAVAKTTEVAKSLITRFFGKPADHSYFVGCSNGGRDAMVASQRLPNEFDGVFALNPGFQLPRAAVNQAWDTQQFANLSTKVFDSFSQTDMDNVSAQVRAACDGHDGMVDGLIQDQEWCAANFDANTLTGLSAPQKAALIAVFGGAKDANGNSFYSDFPWDAGINFRDWRNWKLGRADVSTAGAATGASAAISIGAFSLPAVMMQPSLFITGDSVLTGSTNALAFMQSVKTQLKPNGVYDPELIFATAGIYTTPSMSKTQRGVGFMSGNSISYDTFKARGSKLIVAHGTSDPVFSSNDTKTWYKDLNTAYGGNAATFARYFQIPGMNHCAGGAATDKFDMVSALVNWVEKGIAPDSVTAAARDQSYLYTGAWAPFKPDSFALLQPGTSRPLCAYPKVANSTDNGATWSCK